MIKNSNSGIMGLLFGILLGEIKGVVGYCYS